MIKVNGRQYGNLTEYMRYQQKQVGYIPDRNKWLAWKAEREAEFNKAVMIKHTIHGIINFIITTIVLVAIFWAWDMTAQAAVVDDYDSVAVQDYVDAIDLICQDYGICPEVVDAMVYYESTFNPSAYNKGAVGLLQVVGKWHWERMQFVAEEYGYDVNLYNPYYNLEVGINYLAELSETYEIREALKIYSGSSDYEYSDKVLELSGELERRSEDENSNDVQCGWTARHSECLQGTKQDTLRCYPVIPARTSPGRDTVRSTEPETSGWFVYLRGVGR